MEHQAALSTADPTLAIAEEQLAALGELRRMAVEVSRGYAAAGLAASRAVEVILADELWQPETGRARALAGSKDAADAYQKVFRSLRLTMAMEMSMAETVRDLRAGVIGVPAKDAGKTPAVQLQHDVQDHRRFAGSDSDDRAPDVDRHESEHLVEFDLPDRLPRGTFREVVDHLCATMNIVPDWESYSAGRSPLRYEPLQPKPPGWSECRPPGATPACDPRDEADREAALPP